MRWDAFDGYEGAYIVGHGDLAKIGWSSDLGSRLRQLCAGLPAQQMRLYSWIETDCGRAIEKGLHRRFKALKVNGEWFKFEGQLKDYVAHNLDLFIDGTAATDGDLREAVWRRAVAMSPELAPYKPDPLPDLPRKSKR